MRSDKELLDGMQKAAQGLGWAIDHGLTEIEGKAGP
jgi:hypothetical protein